MSASAAAKVKNVEVYYFERNDVVNMKELLKTPRLLVLKEEVNF